MSKQNQTMWGFLLALAENRYDQATRLIFADFLDDQNMFDEAAYQRKWTPKLQRAIDWMEGFASAHELDYDILIQQGHTFADNGEFHIVLNSDSANEELNSDDTTRKEFWKYWSTIAGKNAPEMEEEYDGNAYDPYSGCTPDCY